MVFGNKDTSLAVAIATAPRNKRMRARRLRAEELQLGTIDARVRHAQLGEWAATVEDVSLHGVALAVAGAAQQRDSIMIGDRLERITLSCEGDELYDGKGIVRRIDERGDHLLLGVALESSGIDLARLHRHGTRVDFAARWQGAQREAEAAHISPAFKSWVGGVAVSLAATQRFLETEEHALAGQDLHTATTAQKEYLAVIQPDLQAKIEESRQALATMVSGLTAEEHADHRAYCAAQIGPYLRQSPFLRRALEKPLGYAGDYEMMNMLYRDPAEGETLLGKALNLCFTDEPAAQANKNRIAYLGRLIRQTLEEHAGERVRIASVGCGPAREIEALLTESPELGPRLEIALIDQEERAIAYCERTLAPLAARSGARIQFIREGLRSLLTRDRLSEKLGHRELIYSAGLFDYLEDRMFSRIVSVLYEALVERGSVVIGNVAAHNPSRWVMEYFAEWFLIHRTPDELRALAAGLTPTPETLRVESEPSGVNLFLHVRR
jgi:extracellular factor (EF) 3-hydroxypalmitic acid methyl ester biosynthesis protein